MIIGKIEIDLKSTQMLNSNELEVVNNYLNNKQNLDIIREMIPIVSKFELTLYTDEEFLPYYLHQGCEYNSVSEEQLQEFIKHKVIDPSKEVSPSYYSNFLYVDGECKDPATGEDMREVEFTPCLIEFSYRSMMTYYIFEWYPDDGHCFEIED